jgi:preprotein translocase subunit Sec61beta
MSTDKIAISTPQSSAGILGISPNLNIGGIKITPQSVVIFAVVFIIIIKIIGFLVNK